MTVGKCTRRSEGGSTPPSRGRTRAYHPSINPRPTPEQIKAYYHSWQWRQLRATRRSIDHNQCQSCGSDTNLQVDHVVAIRDDWNRRTDLTNLITLCQPCHKLKTRQQRRARSARKQRRSQRAQALIPETNRRRNSRRW